MQHQEKTLIIMRHAEADWGLDDFNRPLTRRGHGQAPLAGQWLLESGHVPEMIVSSAALRTRQTTARLAEGLGEKMPTASLDERLYNAPASRILSAINRTPETVQSLMIVAHWPGVQDAATQLANSDSAYDALMDISYGFEPASLAVLKFFGEWGLLAGAQEARLSDFKSF